MVAGTSRKLASDMHLYDYLRVGNADAGEDTKTSCNCGRGIRWSVRSAISAWLITGVLAIAQAVAKGSELTLDCD